MRKICFRLLKGAPPGQEAVNHYISELSIVKGGNHKLDTKYRKHLAMIEVNLDSNFFIPSIRVDCTSFDICRRNSLHILWAILLWQKAGNCQH